MTLAMSVFWNFDFSDLDNMATSPTTVNTRPRDSINRAAAWRWGALVVAMLGLQLCLGIVAIVLATNQNAAVIIPDYYNRALHWDETKAMHPSGTGAATAGSSSGFNEGASQAVSPLSHGAGP